MSSAKRRATLDVDTTLLSRQQVAEMLGIGSWTLNHWVRSAQFPRPIALTDCCHRWPLATVQAWIEAKAREPRRAPRLRGQAARWAAREPIVRVRAGPNPNQLACG